VSSRSHRSNRVSPLVELFCYQAVCDFLVNNVSVVVMVIVVSSSYFITRSDGVATGTSKEHFQITVWVGERSSTGRRGLVRAREAVEDRSSAVAAVWGVLNARGQWVRVQVRERLVRVRGHL